MSNFDENAEAGEFRAGRKVMVVDHDQESMTLHESVLTQFAYDVTTCSVAEDALNLLREKKGSIDLVFVDANVQDMDCFTLLKHIKEEMNLPTILMLGDGDNDNTIRQGIAHGACDFINKPMNKDQIKNMWHHVERMTYSEKMEAEEIEKKRSPSSEDESTKGDNYMRKRPRCVWTNVRKQNFDNAVKLIGIEKASPKTILPLMNDSEVTRSNVASHLQKYRLKLRKSEQDEASSSRMQQSSKSHMQSYSTESTNIPFTICANNNCNLPPRYFSDLMPIPQLPGEDVSYIGPLSQQPAPGNLGGDVNNVGSPGGDADSRQRQS